MRIKAIIVVVTFWLQSCGGIGLFAIGNKSASISNPNISINRGLLREGIAGSNLITSKELLDNWGKPDKIEKVSINKENWTYNLNLRWNGIFALILFIPIPLVVPVGHDYVAFNIEDDRIVSVFMKNDDGKFGILCAYFPPHENGCHSWDSIGNHSNEIPLMFIEKNTSKLLRELSKEK